MPDAADEPLFSDGDAVFALARHIAVEYFDDGALLLDLRKRTMIELDAKESWVVRQLDGERSLGQVVGNCATGLPVSFHEAEELVRAAVTKLAVGQALCLADGTQEEEPLDDVCYVQNPDVILLQGDDEGGLLINRVSSKIQVLNSTGLYIWKLCEPRYKPPLKEIVEAVKAHFDDVPENGVMGDVEQFMKQMVHSGFIWYS